ncbi:MAG: hypothetical protein RIM23_15855 [Coleofasciculus sp. G3-WIS-01]
MTWSANKNQNKFGGLATTKRANEQQNLNDARDGAGSLAIYPTDETERGV